MKKLITLSILFTVAYSAFSYSAYEELANALDTTGIAWHTGGDQLWMAQTGVHDGTGDALRSGVIGDNQRTWVQVTTTFSGLLSYSALILSESGSDFLRVYRNGVELQELAISGTSPGAFARYTLVIPSGENTYRWEYSKDASGSVSADAAWLDRVVIETMPVYHIVANTWPTSEAGSITGDGYYQLSSTCSLSTTPNYGYSFTNWNDTSSILSYSPNYSFVVSSNRNLIAEFVPNKYTMVVSSDPIGGGSTTGQGVWSYNSTATMIANQAEGYAFSGWTDGGTNVSSSASYSFVVKGDRTLVANFLPVRGVTTSSSPTLGGITTGGGNYTSGDSCSVEAMANSGYTFTRWTTNGVEVSTSPTYSFTVSSEVALVAVFSLKSFIISTSSSPSDGGTTSGGGSKLYGTNCTVVASRSPGYGFSNWKVGGSIVSTSASYLFSVTGDKSLIAYFTYVSVFSDVVDSTLTFTVGTGEAIWASRKDIPSACHDGVDMAMTGGFGGPNPAWFKTTVTGPGTISFWACTIMYDNDARDALLFYDGATQLFSTRSQSWVYVSKSIGSGSHVLEWRYTRYSTKIWQTTQGMIDQITWTPN